MCRFLPGQRNKCCAAQERISMNFPTVEQGRNLASSGIYNAHEIDCKSAAVQQRLGGILPSVPRTYLLDYRTASVFLEHLRAKRACDTLPHNLSRDESRPNDQIGVPYCVGFPGLGRRGVRGRQFCSLHQSSCHRNSFEASTADYFRVAGLTAWTQTLLQSFTTTL